MDFPRGKVRSRVPLVPPQVPRVKGEDDEAEGRDGEGPEERRKMMGETKTLSADLELV